MSLQLIFSEIVSCLISQKIGGSFIIKIFDSVTRPTCQLIIKLCQYYEKVYLVKPRTSRYSNSEKYIVCINFKGIDDQDKLNLENIVNQWNESYDKGDIYCRDFGIDVNKFPEITEKILGYNRIIIENQIKYINFALKGPQFTSSYEKQLEAYQNRLAYDFCETFDIIGSKEIHQKVCMHTKTKPHGKLRKCDKCLRLIF